MTVDQLRQTARVDFQKAFLELVDAHQGLDKALTAGAEAALGETRSTLSRAIDRYLYAITSYSACP
jgi:hypothetical protein